MSATPTEIAEALAEAEAPIADGTYANGNDWCILCNATNPHNVSDHYAYCSWRMAKEWWQETLNG